jgi:hypothetical protein
MSAAKHVPLKLDDLALGRITQLTFAGVEVIVLVVFERS